MAKIPDGPAMGRRPTPQPARGVPDTLAAGRGLQEAANIQSGAADNTAQLFRIGGAVATEFAKADIRIQDRDDTAARATALLGFGSWAQTEYQSALAQGDFADRDTAANYTNALREQAATVLSGHGGTETSRMALATRLEEVRVQFTRQAATQRIEAQNNRVNDALAAGLGNLTANALRNPGSMPQLFESLDAQIADASSILTAQQQLDLQVKGRQEIAANALESYLNAGDLEAAQAVIGSNSGVLDILSPAKQREMIGRVQEIQNDRTAGARAAQRQLDEFRVLTGREPTIADRNRMAGLPSAEGMSSAPGKIIEDAQKIETLYGADSPQMRAFAELSNSDTVPTLTEEAGMRKEFTSLSKPFIDTMAAMTRIRSVTGPEATGADDLALIFNFMKMLDPGSVVRESEFALAETTGNWSQQIEGARQRVITGERLEDGVRQNFVLSAENIYQGQVLLQRRLEQSFEGIAGGYGIDSSRVVIDFIGDSRASRPEPTEGAEPPVSRTRMDLQGNVIGAP